MQVGERFEVHEFSDILCVIFAHISLNGEYFSEPFGRYVGCITERLQSKWELFKIITFGDICKNDMKPFIWSVHILENDTLEITVTSTKENFIFCYKSFWISNVLTTQLLNTWHVYCINCRTLVLSLKRKMQEEMWEGKTFVSSRDRLYWPKKRTGKRFYWINNDDNAYHY